MTILKIDSNPVDQSYMSENTKGAMEIDENWAGPSKEEFEGDLPAAGSFAADSLDLAAGKTEPVVDIAREPSFEEDSDMASLLANETSNHLHVVPKLATGASTNLEHYVGFMIKNTEYTLALPYVQKVIPLPRLTATPQNDPSLIGVIDFEGEIIPVVDTAKRLGFLTRTVKSRFSVLLICEFGSGKQAFLVDSLTQVHRFDSLQSSEPPRGINGNYISGFFRTENKVLLNLDPYKISESFQHAAA